MTFTFFVKIKNKHTCHLEHKNYFFYLKFQSNLTKNNVNLAIFEKQDRYFGTEVVQGNYDVCTKPNQMNERHKESEESNWHDERPEPVGWVAPDGRAEVAVGEVASRLLRLHREATCERATALRRDFSARATNLRGPREDTE